MDVNDLRTVLMLAAFVAFVGIVAWAWSRRAARGFDEAAQLPFAEDKAHGEHDTGTKRERA